jgi:hypothetical protein
MPKVSRRIQGKFEGISFDLYLLASELGVAILEERLGDKPSHEQ